MSRTNVFEAANRAKKTAALVATVAAMIDGPILPAHIALMRSWSLVDWAAIATRAGINAPSKHTANDVIDTLDRLRGLRSAA